MYDVMPYTYGTFDNLNGLLTETGGDLETVNHHEFKKFIDRRFDAKGILELLKDRGVEITIKDKDIVEKTGLLALVGTVKAIDQGMISKGNNVLCCLTSGVSNSDGQASPEYKIINLDQDLAKYTRFLEDSTSL